MFCPLLCVCMYCVCDGGCGYVHMCAYYVDVNVCVYVNST